MMKLLELKPEKRMRAKEALNHEYLKVPVKKEEKEEKIESADLAIIK